MKTGIELIAEERQRQVEHEGYMAEHDDEHDKGELRSAAMCYLYYFQNPCLGVPSQWPWGPEYWKQAHTVRDLVKAGALIAAEIDRVQRLGSANAIARETGTSA